MSLADTNYLPGQKSGNKYSSRSMELNGKRDINCMYFAMCKTDIAAIYTFVYGSDITCFTV